MAIRTFRGPDAPFSNRPLTWREFPTVLAILALIPSGFATLMGFSLSKHGFPDDSFTSWSAIAAVCATWLVLFGAAQWSRRWRRDPCLDVISWLLPSRGVYEVSGTHFEISGWLTSGKTPYVRVLVLAQNNHRGKRDLTVTLIPRNPQTMDPAGPLEITIPLDDSGVAVAFDSRRLVLREGALEFDLLARVRIATMGTRTRLRRGSSPKSKWLEPAKTLIHLHNPVFALADMVVHRKDRDQAPVTFIAQEAMEPYPWPSERVHHVWSPEAGWTQAGLARDWLCQWSERLSGAIREGIPLPMRDGEPHPTGMMSPSQVSDKASAGL